MLRGALVYPATFLSLVGLICNIGSHLFPDWPRTCSPTAPAFQVAEIREIIHQLLHNSIFTSIIIAICS